MTHYDAIVVGAGAGGGVAAGVLAEAGRAVLLLERGAVQGYADERRDHLRNHRLARYGHSTGPALSGHPRVFVDPAGVAHPVRPFDPGYHNNAMAVGGGTLVYGAQAWRFLPQDFRMAQEYGVPAGSSLADWPLTYDDLAPDYERAEWEVGVSGDSVGARRVWPRARDYPLPPVPHCGAAPALARAADALGWPHLIPPLLINTAPRHGRAACTGCQHCVGFACPVDAKNGTQNTLIPRGLATGRLTLQPGAFVDQIEVTPAGRVRGVRYIDAAGQLQHATADVVVISAGAIETARLLLHSRSAAHPAGLGNRYDQVGRHLQGHYYPRAIALMPEPIYDGVGPGVSIATTRFNHGNDGIIGGGMLANDFIVLPVIFWRGLVPPEVPRWGAANKAFMRQQYRHVAQVMGPVQDIPNPEARVTLDPAVRDRHDVPVARLSGTTHPETVRTAEFMWRRAHEWLQAAGAVRTWGPPPGLMLSAGQHQAGTCRMGHDPHSSVTDASGRVHGHDNLYIADASLHVTNGGFNPVLTVMALAFRVARAIAGR